MPRKFQKRQPRTSRRESTIAQRREVVKTIRKTTTSEEALRHPNLSESGISKIKQRIQKKGLRTRNRNTRGKPLTHIENLADLPRGKPSGPTVLTKGLEGRIKEKINRSGEERRKSERLYVEEMGGGFSTRTLRAGLNNQGYELKDFDTVRKPYLEDEA